MRPPVIDPRWIRGPADELALEQGCYFDDDAGRRAVYFVERFCRQSKGRWAGKPLTLLDWQLDFNMRLFGWKRADGLRRYRRAYLEVAKKNGKSTMLSGDGLYLGVGDGEPAPEVYLNACDKDQASIIFEEMRRMVEVSPDLRSRLEIINSKADKRIVHPAGNGAIIVNSSVAASKDGFNPSAIIFDELHRQPDRRLWDVFEYAGAAREQPLTLSITTAGESDEGVWYEQRDYSEKVNAGVIPDTSHLGVIYRALESDDIDDPATWRKANPSLGETIRPDDFARELAEAKQVPVKMSNFKRLRLNIIARETGYFVDPKAWDDCSGPVDAKALRGEPCWAGLDLSKVKDLTALAAVIPGDDDMYNVIARFWLPEDNIVELEHEDGVPYRDWAGRGWITLTPGNVVDYAFVRAEVVALASEYGLRKLLLDPYNATQLAVELAEEDGLPVEFVRQGFLSLSAPTKELDRLVRSGKLRHGGNPVLRWMARNAVADTDPAGNVKLSKRRSRRKIDGIAALVNALAGLVADPDEGGSVYETRGLIFL